MDLRIKERKGDGIVQWSEHKLTEQHDHVIPASHLLRNARFIVYLTSISLVFFVVFTPSLFLVRHAAHYSSTCIMCLKTIGYLIITNFRATLIWRIWKKEYFAGLKFRDFEESPFFKVIKFRESSNWCSFFFIFHFCILFNHNGIETQQATG